MFKSKFHGMSEEVIFPDFPDDENTTTTTITKSRRVSFGTNFVKEFVVGSAVSAQCVSEYEQAFSSSDSSIGNSSHSAMHGSSTFSHNTFVMEESLLNHNPIPSISVHEPSACSEGDTANKCPKFSRTICFNADSPTADVEFTEGCINLAKTILDKKNKEMTVIIQAKSKETQNLEETKYFDGSQFDMSITQCFRSKEKKREERKVAALEKSKNFGEYDVGRKSKNFKTKPPTVFSNVENDLGSSDSCKENKIPLDMIIGQLDKDTSDLENLLFHPKQTLNDVLNMSSFNLGNESENFVINNSDNLSKASKSDLFEATFPNKEPFKIHNENENENSNESMEENMEIESENLIEKCMPPEESMEVESEMPVDNFQLDERSISADDEGVIAENVNALMEESNFLEKTKEDEFEMEIDKSKSRIVEMGEESMLIDSSRFSEQSPRLENEILANSPMFLSSEANEMVKEMNRSKGNEIVQDLGVSKEHEIVQDSDLNRGNETVNKNVNEISMNEGSKLGDEMDTSQGNEIVQDLNISKEVEMDSGNEMVKQMDVNKGNETVNEMDLKKGNKLDNEMDLNKEDEMVNEMSINKGNKLGNEMDTSIRTDIVQDLDVSKENKIVNEVDINKGNERFQEVNMNKENEKVQEVEMDSENERVQERDTNSENEIVNEMDINKGNERFQEMDMNKGNERVEKVEMGNENERVQEINMNSGNEIIKEVDASEQNQLVNEIDVNKRNEIFQEMNINKGNLGVQEMEMDSENERVQDINMNKENEILNEMDMNNGNEKVQETDMKSENEIVKEMDANKGNESVNEMAINKEDEVVNEMDINKGNEKVQKVDMNSENEIVKEMDVNRENEVVEEMDGNKGDEMVDDSNADKGNVMTQNMEVNKGNEMAQRMDVNKGNEMAQRMEVNKGKETEKNGNEFQIQEGIRENVKISRKKDPPLVDVKVLENLREQSTEEGCIWTLEGANYEGEGNAAEWIVKFKLLESFTTIRFHLEVSKEEEAEAEEEEEEEEDDDFSCCSIVKTTEIHLIEERKLRRHEYRPTLEFGFHQAKKYLEKQRKIMKTVLNASYFLDLMNSFIIKLNSFLRQIYTILTQYPGSRLNDSLLSFRLFSFPIFFSATVSVQLNDLYQLSRSSLSFEYDFGSLNEKEICEIFEDSLKMENSLCEFVIRSTKHLIDTERKSGSISKRDHIRLLPPEFHV